jgi:hypothetical protein
VSLDPEDHDWVKGFKGPSDSYTVSRIVKAARLSGMTLDDAMTGGVLEDLCTWLKAKRKKTNTGDELQQLLSEYIEKRG